MSEVEPHLTAWHDLATRALEDNFYLSPDFISAVLRRYVTKNRALIVFVYRIDDQVESLVAVASFSLRRSNWRMPLPVLCGMISPHGFLSHPLVDRQDASAALQALNEWLLRPEHPWRLIFFYGISETSPFFPRLQAELTRQKVRFLSKPMFLRPMLHRHENFNAYLAALSSARRKNFRRRWQQLQAAGSVEVILHQNLARSVRLADDFMQLERLGWKGMRGTALACKSADADFFRDLVNSNAATNRLFFVELKLNGRSIAMTANFLCGQTLFAFKIAYDPQFQIYSPGILAEIQTVKLFHETAGLVKGEGGATGNSYLRSYWRDMTQMQGLYIATPHRRSQVYLLFLSAVWRIKNIFRQITHRSSKLFCANVCFDNFYSLNETALACCQLT
ncbi:MAG: GNAT family N-acetyltransferase [Gammaproteobacteria bacterium]|nr:GNAT family N-acetyltransferase [Gammaproteobacteria bacterium]